MKKKDFSHLSSEEYEVLRNKATEKPFSGKLYYNKEKGSYHCKACGNKLFESKDKFDSGTGWPSFHEALEGSVELKPDFKLIIPRIEVICSKCSSHLGHLFNDSPFPLGKRFCINSIALKFKKK